DAGVGEPAERVAAARDDGVAGELGAEPTPVVAPTNPLTVLLGPVLVTTRRPVEFVMVPVLVPIAPVLVTTRVVGAFPDGQSALNLAAARLRHIAGTAWSTKRYLNVELLKDQQMRGAITA